MRHPDLVRFPMTIFCHHFVCEHCFNNIKNTEKRFIYPMKFCMLMTLLKIIDINVRDKKKILLT